MSLFAHWWPLLCLTGWLLISAGLLVGWHRWDLMQRADMTRRAQYPPPVPRPTTPPLTQTVPSADWFRDIPVDCLSDDAVRPLFDDIVRGEFA